MPHEPETEVHAVLCTCPDEETAGRLAGGLVESRLAACVNILPGVRSVYRWQGRVEAASETLMIIKTTGARLPELESWLLENHPYEVPEVVALPVAGGLQAYLEWVADETD